MAAIPAVIRKAGGAWTNIYAQKESLVGGEDTRGLD